MDKNDVQSDVFHDLNKYRQAILHRSNRLGSKPKALPYFKEGDEVSPTSDQIELIFRGLIDDELNRIGREYYHTDLGFRFDKRLN